MVVWPIEVIRALGAAQLVVGLIAVELVVELAAVLAVEIFAEFAIKLIEELTLKLMSTEIDIIPENS
jgi:hypothetical protein